MNFITSTIGIAGLLLSYSSPACAAVIFVSTPELRGVTVGIGNWPGLHVFTGTSWSCDFDGDGNPEVLITSPLKTEGFGIYARPYSGVEILAGPYPQPYVTDMGICAGFFEGDVISESTPSLFGPDGSLLWADKSYRNAWFNMLSMPTADGQAGTFFQDIRYMGVRFQKSDGWHYGWIGASGGTSGMGFFDYAWETEPNTAISAGLVPETHSALLLGTASIILAMMRRRTAGT